MPIQPPSSTIPTQPPQPAAGLSRARSLRRPQAGPSASASASASVSSAPTSSRETTGARAAPSIAPSNGSSSSLATRGSSPSRLPVKPLLNSAAASTATGATGTKPRPPSASGGLSARLRRPDATSASSTAKPPSSSRTHLLPSATAGGVTRRPTSSGGLPPSSSSTKSGTAPFGQTSRTRPPTAATSGPLRGHTRNKSASIVPTSSTSSATTTTRPPSRPLSRPPSAAMALTSAPVLRPPSAQSSSTGSSSTANNNSRPPTRGAAAGTAATATAATTRSGTTAASNKGPPVTAHRRHESASAATAHHRPAFSTLQQHFSPAKNLAPKPRIAAILAPPASPSKKPANVALSAETGRLQTTLLQLHLLHRDAATVTAEWHASARRALAGERFSTLAADHAELMQMAGQRAETVNAAALQEWGQPGGGGGEGGDGPYGSFDLTLEEKIQALDSLLSGVWSLAGGQNHQGHGGSASSSTSRYVHVVRRFERWAQQTAALMAARQRVDTLDELMDDEDDDDDDSSSSNSDGGGDDHRTTGHRGGNNNNNNNIAAGFLSSEKEPLLDAAWHEECGHLTHRLEGWQRQLERLGRGTQDAPQSRGEREGERDKDAQPSLHRMLTGCRSLVDGMLEELRVMQQLERDAAEQELVWIRQMNATAGVSNGSGGIDLQSHAQQQHARAGAIWRAR